ncbi:MAG: tRNA (adenosine(37)-N6)-dimethylallyltransferase MiaA [Oscillospiraceae bacterium]|nr:tRNA (adenosine(37)-N6)-dimethylallyltransferase MiaA [Oscillospiraceae bacterium]
MSKKILVICGPTATGKTLLGIELALSLGGEIVSADSMQIYRRMDIGTAKATPEERAAVPHHMLDVAEPQENWSVARYVEEAARCCDDILARGKLPILVGGTGLYIDSLIAGRDFAENDGDAGLREKLNADWDRLGGGAMHERLRAVDPERAEKLAVTDRRRIVRALEVWELTGKTITEHDEETRRLPPRYEAKRVVLTYADRAALYARIDRRVDAMADQGLFEEVAGLLADGVPADCTAMQAIGYKEAAQALRGEISRAEALEQIKMASRRYAKRQLTWFRRAPDALWIEWTGEPDFSAAAGKIVLSM